MPGPGSYDTSTSADLAAKGNSFDARSLSKGMSFGKSGLTRDNSGLRELSTDPSSRARHLQVISPRLPPSGMETRVNDGLMSSVSFISLKNKTQIKAAEASQGWSGVGLQGYSSKITMHLNQPPIDVRRMLSDQSVTHLNAALVKTDSRDSLLNPSSTFLNKQS